MFDENPYASPSCSAVGFWDKTLFRQIVKASCILTAWFLIMDVVIWLEFFTFNNGQIGALSAYEQVKAFFIDWEV